MDLVNQKCVVVMDEYLPIVILSKTVEILEMSSEKKCQK